MFAEFHSINPTAYSQLLLPLMYIVVMTDERTTGKRAGEPGGTSQPTIHLARTSRIVKLLIVRGILNEEHMQKM